VQSLKRFISAPKKIPEEPFTGQNLWQKKTPTLKRTDSGSDRTLVEKTLLTKLLVGTLGTGLEKSDRTLLMEKSPGKERVSWTQDLVWALLRIKSRERSLCGFWAEVQPVPRPTSTSWPAGRT
jgi:hypothetical protein